MELLSVELAQIAGALGIGAIDVLVIVGLTGLIGRLFKNSAVRDVALPIVCILVANAVLWGAELVPDAYEKFATATAFGAAVTGLYPWFNEKLKNLGWAKEGTV